MKNLNINSVFESGKLIAYTVINFRRLESKDGIKYRGVCSLLVEIEGCEAIQYNNVKVSSLLVYNISVYPDYYLGKRFESYNTSTDIKENPFRFNVSSDNQYFNLSNVYEKGVKEFTVQMPNGEIHSVKKFVNWSKDNYLRYYKKQALEATK